MKNLRKSIGAAICCAIVIAAVGCTSGSSEGTAGGGATATGGGEKKKELHLAFVTNNASDFWTIARKGVEKADAEMPDVTVEFRLPGQGTADEQQTIVNDLLSKGIDGLAISPVDPANETEFLNGVAEKTLLFTQDSDAPESKRALYVGTDNVAAGKQAGEQILKSLPNGGKIMVFVGKADAQNAKERFDGIKEALKGSKVEIIDVRTDNTDRAQAKTNVSDTLVKYPDIAGLVGLWSYNGPAIYNAVKEAGKVGKVKIICFDEEEETLQGVEEGAIDATIVQQPYEFGYQAVKLLAQVKGGDTSVIPADKKKIVETKVIDKATVAEFATKLKELRGK